MTEARTPHWKILYVDDEPQALKYFQRAFSSEFAVCTAESAQRAWDILGEEEGQLGVLLTDQRMPGEKGVELLKRVSARYPLVVRILVTAFSDLDTAIDAVNQGGAFRYVTKPWKHEDLRSTLRQALEFFDARQERDSLLREKLHAFQRMLVLDRLRALVVATSALRGRLRDPHGALRSFLEQHPAPASHAGLGPPSPLDLATVARAELLAFDRTVGDFLAAKLPDAPPRISNIHAPQLVQVVLDECQNRWPSHAWTMGHLLAPAEFRGDAAGLRALLVQMLEVLQSSAPTSSSFEVSWLPVDVADRLEHGREPLPSSSATASQQPASTFAPTPQGRFLIRVKSTQDLQRPPWKLSPDIWLDNRPTADFDCRLWAAFLMAHHLGCRITCRDDRLLGPELALVIGEVASVEDSALDPQWLDVTLTACEDG